ncbi:hypothetical protein LJC63_02010 [Ruminococcaceae bacterium OttesenSCG-928-L11]|nr:hypothetical protein [Ruminococcaceae bacterium OttesenSCG-928-L11]
MPEDIAEKVASHYGISMNALRSRNRDRHVSEARTIAICWTDSTICLRTEIPVYIISQPTKSRTFSLLKMPGFFYFPRKSNQKGRCPCMKS